MSASSPIGILDSGFGGLSVARAVRTALPGEDLLYAADCGFAPWGDRTDDFINARLDQIVSFLLERGAKAIVLACNTATAVAAKRLRKTLSIPVIGIEPAVLPAAKVTRSGIVGVMATTKTLSSSKYQCLRERLPETVRIIDRPCPGLMDRVEAGDFSSDVTRTLLHAYIDPLISAGTDTLVLGCTHYPFLSKTITEIAGPNVTLIDPAPAVARQLTHRLAEANLLSNQKAGGTEAFYTTDATPARARVLQALWNEHALLQELPR